MNLSEAAEVGRQGNFNDAVAVTRRDFLAGTVAAGIATGAGLGSIVLGTARASAARCASG